MKNLILCLALTSALGLGSAFGAVQDPAPTQDDGWRDFDGVALIVNGDIVTLRELNKLLGEAKAREAATTNLDSRALLEEITEQKITMQLQTQAGAGMGIAQEDVERTIERYLADQRRGKSAEETEAWLEMNGANDLGEMRQYVNDSLYRSFWVESQRGLGAGGGRPWRDRYVRPGQLKEAYEVNKENLGEPTTFRLQFLVLATAAWGDEETTLDAIEGFREQVLAGDDMGALVDEYGATLRETRGITDWIPLRSIADPAVRAFCESATEGAVSDVIRIVTPEGELQGCQVVRIVARIEGQPAPPFHDGPTQSELSKRLQTGWDNARVTRGSDELWRSAFIRGPSSLQISPPWVRRQGQRARRATEVDH